jgi:four helix bundle protein
MQVKTELEYRTKQFAVETIKVVRTFPRTVDGIEIGRQLLKAGTSIGANYREANRAESKSDFIHKIGLAEKEASETGYWLEICSDSRLGPAPQIKSLLDESCELLAILTTIGRKAKGR